MKVVYPTPDPKHLCDCICHDDPPGAIHIMPCCSGCECGANIKDECWDAHKATCKPKKNRHKDHTP